MKELFEKFLMNLCLSGIGIIAVVALARYTLPAVAQKVKAATEAIRRNGVIAAFIAVVFVCGMIVYGSTKNNAPSNDPPAQTQMIVSPTAAVESRPAHIEGEIVRAGHQAVSPSPVPTNALGRVEKWWCRGALNDGHIVTFDEDWRFPHGTNHLASIEVWSSGAVYASEKDPTPIAELVAKLSLAPHDTEVFAGRTTNNTYRIEWHGGHPNRDPSQTADASIELFRNGNVIVAESGVSVAIPYSIPFPHDGYGQDETWVRANYANADEILSIGYRQWVERQVGVGLANGLYQFSAEFLVDPPEPTELYIGDYTVCVTNAGVYSFVLEKGTEYEFGTWPFNDGVDYWAQDDMASGSPMLRSIWGGGGSPGEWTIDGGWNCLSVPTVYLGQYYTGYCSWWPTLQGTPDVTHLRATDFPQLFSAVVSDYPNPDGLNYEWHSSDDNVMIMSPHSRETLVAVDSMPSWDVFDLAVSTEINGLSYFSSVRICYGTNETPVASLRMSAPKVVFVNDDGRTSRWYRVSAQLVSPTPTNAVLSIAHAGGAQVRFATDPEGLNGLVLTNVNLAVASPMSSAGYEFFFAATNNNCAGTFTATCTLADSTVLTANREYKVIEPLRKLACKEQVSGMYCNPSRLVYGTNAWLKVGVNGQFSASEVQWRVVSGPGRIVSRNDGEWAVSVEPTAPSGEVVVEAAFGNDSPIQPRFVLPIVAKRTLPVKAFVVGTNTVSSSVIEAKIEYANKIFMQAGICLELVSVSNNVALASDCIVAEFDNITNSSGHVRKVVSQQARRIMDTYTVGDCLELYFVAKIINGKAVAFRTPRGIIVSERATDHVVAHEIGHCLGLKDCYASRRTAAGYVWIEQRNNPISADFMSKPYDWGAELKRGFYDTSDTREQTLYSFLMYGVDGKDGVDIPSGDVLSLTKDATLSSQTQRSLVGADYIKPNNNEVFTR